ncbi:hypothetical protein H5410_056525 [Solanum commersonii]|uniref:Uncharacterized protein n=1 Tax=Solanum commersonii TaxID=4109 RepID=A0A9J5WMF5_SOLCO|nr:hypothetical protein H5410_056525 [Solanum commersonii]
MDSKTRKLANSRGGLPALCSFDRENGPVFPLGPITSIAKVLTDSTKDFGKNDVGNPAKWGVYLLWGSFDLANGLVYLSGPTDSITKVLTDIHNFFLAKMTSKIQITKGSMYYSTQKLT